jgi:antirestriction protein ArdC
MNTKKLNKMKNKKAKFDIAETITNQLVEIIETTGHLPWEKEWSGQGSMFGVDAPRNFESKKAYRGSNILMLLSRGFASPWWMTYKQAKNKGGSVIKGSKGTMVVYWTMLFLDKNGKRCDEAQAEKKIPYLKYSNVFNAEQIEGIDFPEIKKPDPKTVEDSKNAAIQAAEDVIDGYENAPITKFGGDRACYSPSIDQILMPKIADFNCSESFYKTFFHEMVHSTGHKKRLNRDGVATNNGGFGSEKYSKEELVAELGAAFLASVTGCWGKKQEKNSAAYLKSWIKELKNDPKMIIAASGAAQKAAEHILGASLDEYQPLPEEMKPEPEMAEA